MTEPKSNYQKRALELANNLKDKGAINNRELGTLRRAILLKPETPQGEYKCVSCKYRSCEITEKPCRECSHSWVDRYEEADMRGVINDG